MKKNFYWMFAAILFCSAMTTVFTSCSKDDDNNTPEPQKEQITAKKATAWYAASMGEDMLDVFDVEVTTSGPQIGKETKKLTKTKFSMADNDANVNDAGLVFTMSVKITRKAGFTPDASKSYKLGFGSAFAYEIIGTNGKSLVGDGEKSAILNTITIPGDKLEERIQRLIETWQTLDQKLEVHKTYYVYNGRKESYE